MSGDTFTLHTTDPLSCNLHSHPFNWREGEEEFQQVTCYEGEDGNNLWRITAAGGSEEGNKKDEYQLTKYWHGSIPIDFSNLFQLCRNAAAKGRKYGGLETSLHRHPNDSESQPELNHIRSCNYGRGISPPPVFYRKTNILGRPFFFVQTGKEGRTRQGIPTLLSTPLPLSRSQQRDQKPVRIQTGLWRWYRITTTM
eukprot:sb/3470844/